MISDKSSSFQKVKRRLRNMKRREGNEEKYSWLLKVSSTMIQLENGKKNFVWLKPPNRFKKIEKFQFHNKL